MDKEELYSKVAWCLDTECNCEECFYGRCNYHKDGVISLLKEIIYYLLKEMEEE